LFPADDADIRREKISENQQDQREKKQEKFPADDEDLRTKKKSASYARERIKKASGVFILKKNFDLAYTHFCPSFV